MEAGPAGRVESSELTIDDRAARDGRGQLPQQGREAPPKVVAVAREEPGLAAGAERLGAVVIVKPLEGGAESFRALSDKNGGISERELAPGPYQIIATCPYGLCQTTVREIMVKSEPFSLEFSLAVAPTSGNTVTVGNIEHREVQVEDEKGKPIRFALVFVRDAIAQNERWYKSGNGGLTIIDVPPGAEMTVVAIDHGKLVSSVVKSRDAKEKIILRFK